ncbi:MAG TPA: hypothetical protein VNX01_07700 [Bacteroidia bacterium]|jgi:hypothetical protein|nr:hypothetical protein [Bacteroidia bacterium]
MPNENFTVDTIKTVLPQLSKLASRVKKIPNGKETKLEISEAIEVCFINASDLINTTKDYKDIIKLTGKWHLQIKNNEVHSHFARISYDKEKAKWQINSFFESAIPALINSGLNWISKNIKGDVTLKLLEIPTYFLTALILENIEGVRVLVVHKPESLAIESFKLYTFNDFRGFFQSIKPIQGVK